jgi:hypothetical protein
VTIDSDADIQIEFVETAAVVWQEITVSIDGIGSLDELRKEIESCIEEIRPENMVEAAICRLTLTGRGEVHRDLVQEGALNDLSEFFREQECATEHAVYVERFIDQTALPLDRKMLMQRGDLVADVVALSEHMQQNGEIPKELAEELGYLFEMYRRRGILKEIDETELRALIQGAETYLLDHLMQGDCS